MFASLVFSFILAGTKLGLYEIAPGCGVGSGCDAVTNGPWGSIPAIGWPVSFVGVAWFASMCFCWLWGGSKFKTFLWLARIGVLGSVGFFIIMLSIGHLCKWCAFAHICNIAFWIVAELEYRSQSTGKNRGSLASFVLLFVLVSALLGIVQFFVSSNQKDREKIAVLENVVDVLWGNSDASTLRLLEATHRIGPANAPVQVVIFTDYQCPDCKRIEGELAAIVAQRNDVSVAVKHFPLCFDCNDNIGTFKLHANACWAARAAEAAAIVGGEEGWERMHTWLFEQGGRFTDQTFHVSLSALGFDAQDFVQVMMSDDTLQRVKAETNDGAALGIYFTPMVFINGVEYLWYYGGQESLASLVDSVAKNLVAGSDEVIVPPNASEKLVEDWRRGRTFDTPGHENLSWTGDGPVEFVVWGDYQAPLSAELDAEIQNLLNEKNSQIKYAFRHFPVDELCNSGISQMPTKYNGSCYLSKLVEAVNILAGNEPRWKMHRWILAQQKPVNLNSAALQAASLSGFDLDVIQDVVDGIEINSLMRLDIMAKNGVWRKSIPVITIDGRFVPRWRNKKVTASDLFHRIIGVVGLEDAEADSR